MKEEGHESLEVQRGSEGQGTVRQFPEGMGAGSGQVSATPFPRAVGPGRKGGRHVPITGLAKSGGEGAAGAGAPREAHTMVLPPHRGKARGQSVGRRPLLHSCLGCDHRMGRPPWGLGWAHGTLTCWSFIMPDFCREDYVFSPFPFPFPTLSLNQARHFLSSYFPGFFFLPLGLFGQDDPTQLGIN